jgi:hypothetical protein
VTVEPRPWLPHLLREMSEAFDLRTALRFAEQFGGRYLRLPAAAGPEHPVAVSMGVPVLAWLVDRHYRMERITVPKGPSRDRAQMAALIRGLAAEHRTADQIAAATGLHVRTVHAWKARLRAEDEARQMDLFRRGGVA